MGFFKKRTFKSVGREIGSSIKRQKQKQKILRTLKLEEAEREKERGLSREIKELKSKKPSFTKSALKFARKGTAYYKRKQAESLARAKKRKGTKIKPLSVGDLF